MVTKAIQIVSLFISFFLYTEISFLSNIIINTEHYFHSFALHTKCKYSELFWSAFFPHFPVFCPNAGKCRKNADLNNSEYGLFLRSEEWSFSDDKSESEIEDFVWQLSPGEKYPSDERKIFCGVRVETKGITDQLRKT